MYSMYVLYVCMSNSPIVLYSLLAMSKCCFVFLKRTAIAYCQN